jgi:hypothetical protein
VLVLVYGYHLWIAVRMIRTRKAPISWRDTATSGRVVLDRRNGAGHRNAGARRGQWRRIGLGRLQPSWAAHQAVNDPSARPNPSRSAIDPMKRRESAAREAQSLSHIRSRR